MTIFHFANTRFAPRRIAVLIGLAAVCHAVLQSQTPTGARSGDGVRAAAGASGATGNSATQALSVIPQDGRRFLQKLGKRLSTASEARTTYAGSLTDASGTSSSMSLIWEYPGKVRMDISSQTPQTLIYDGTSSQSLVAMSAANQHLLETLTDDLSESFFVSLGHGAAYRSLGEHYRTDGGKTANYQGPFYALFQKFGTIPSTQAPGQKLYMFDSIGGLLARVRYYENVSSKQTPVEVRFSKWFQVSGESFAGQISRVINGVPEFTLAVTSAALSPAGSSQTFTLATQQQQIQ